MRLGRRIALGALAAALSSGCGAQLPDRPQILLSSNAEALAEPSIDVVGLSPGTLAALRAAAPSPAEWKDTFAVYVGDDLPETPTLPPVLGSYSTERDRVRFHPRFPLVPGLSYTVLWRPPVGRDGARAGAVRAVVALPARDIGEATTVLAVHPSTDLLPENQLKLYIHFSAPMRRGGARRHLRLYELEGPEVRAPFAMIDRELWDRETTRLTVFFDPGRTKRGVGPNLEVGPPLRAGRAYRLLVDRGWQDAAGRSLSTSFEKHFRVVAADRTQPDPRGWELSPPSARNDPLALVFPEAMDRALLGRLLQVVDAGGASVAGEVGVSDGDRRWSFTPHAPWRAGRYELRVDPDLEDLAGNTPRRAFETPVGSGVGEMEMTQEIRLPFRALAGGVRTPSGP